MYYLEEYKLGRKFIIYFNDILISYGAQASKITVSDIKESK